MSLKSRLLLRMSAVRFALQLSLLFVVMLTVAGVFLSSFLERQVRNDIDEELEFRAELIAQELGEIASIRELFELWRGAENVDYATSEAFRLNDGRVLGPVNSDVFDQPGFLTLEEDDLLTPEYLLVLYSEFRGFEEFIDDAEEFEFGEIIDPSPWRVYVEELPSGTVAVFTPIDGIEDTLTVIPTILLPTGVILVVSTLLGGAVLGARQQRRMREISDGLQRISRGVLDQPIAPVHSRDDIDDIMLQIDETAERLDVSLQQMRDFSHSVAHELRTPLAKLRAELESPNIDDPNRALDQADELIRIFDALQRIARLKQKPIKGALNRVSLAEIVELIGDLLGDVAEEAGHALSISTSHDVSINGDKQMLLRLVSNLVENAIQHAGERVEIMVETTANGLSVTDNGGGIRAAALERILEPFQHGQFSEGTGLGLALVKAIADYHDAILTICNRPNSEDGLRISLEFPANKKS